MRRYINLICAFVVGLTTIACNSNKPQPVSDTVSKTSLTINGKKDSVINNPQKDYGNATIAEPCVKCLLQTVQANEAYKQDVSGKTDLKFVVNYVKGTLPADTVPENKATNALRVDVVARTAGNNRVSSFLFDNAVNKLYHISGKQKVEVKTDSISLKKIRNSCYWGVASGK